MIKKPPRDEAGQLLLPMVRRGAGFDADQTRRKLFKERQDRAPLQLAADDHIANGINSVNLKDRLGDIQTDCRNCLHDWLLRMVGALPATPFVALTCRWRSRPQHQRRTSGTLSNRSKTR